MTIFGFSVTITYVVFVVWFLWEKLLKLDELKLNEFGDFFAGVFGPLMLFWLIWEKTQKKPYRLPVRL